MDIHEFGQENREKILLIPGNMMSWRQFRDVIPLLAAETYRVIAVSTDGYDDTGETTFTTARDSAPHTILSLRLTSVCGMERKNAT